LEAILQSHEGAYRVEIQPSGEVRAVKRFPCSPACTHDDARTPGHPERVKERSEAFEQLVCDHEDSTVYHKGAEAMRAACWEAVAARLEVEGYDRGGALLLGLKAAIEGATP
jgi:hypothetical protein